MENIILPAIVAGLVFTVFMVIAQRSSSDDGSQRKRDMLGRLIQDNKDSSEMYEVKLFRDDRGSESSFLYNFFLLRPTYDLLVKSGMWEKRKVFLLASLGMLILMSVLLSNFGPSGFVVALLVAYLLPHRYLSHIIVNRNEKFLDMFPDAIDLIVRSVKSGHPTNTAMRMITENMPSPISDEFKQVTDEVSYGRTLPEALRRMSDRLLIPDVDFFVVVLSVQQETGGSLTEVLTNLSSIIRKRKQLRAKIRAMTAEGRATAYILGGIPVVEFMALYYMTPSYMDPLFTTFAGNIMLGGACLLIFLSQVVIRKLINIDI
jgi:tight adherence protein B